MRTKSVLRAALLTLALTLIAPRVAEAAPSWNDGTVQYSQAVNCPSMIFGSSIIESDAAVFAGVYTDLANPPRVGEVFYIRAMMYGMGRPCAGPYGNLEFQLDPDLRLAISPEFPVICALQRAGKDTWEQVTQDCPQKQGSGRFGMSFNPTSQSTPLWPLPQDTWWQVQIPVYATKELKGMGGSGMPCGDCFQAHVQILDGNSSPWLVAGQSLYTQAAEPAAGFPNPFATVDAAQRTVTTTVYDFNYFIPGRSLAVVTEDSNDDGVLDSSDGPSYLSAEMPATANDYAIEIKTTWSGLKPNQRYFYEQAFMPDGGSDWLVSPEHSFVTGNWPAPPPTQTVGTSTNAIQSAELPPQAPTPPTQPDAPADSSSTTTQQLLENNAPPDKRVEPPPGPGPGPGPDPGPGPPPPPGKDTTKPAGTLRIGAKQKPAALVKNGLTAKLTCSENAQVTASLTVTPATAVALKLAKSKPRKPVTVASAKASCIAGKQLTLKLKPSAKLAARLGTDFKASLAVTLVDGAGNRGLATATIKFKH